MTRPDDTLGIYIHVPFCASRCPYCDFYSHCDRALIPDYVSAVTDELATLRRTVAAADVSGIQQRKTVSVYFGGGTPSLLSPAQIGMILEAVRANYRLLPDAEITLEANPGLREPETYFAAIAKAGVNRVSLGMQSAVAEERKKLGRRSGKAEIGRCLAAARAAGIENLSLDIMAGIPGQTIESLQETLTFALEQNVPHLSVYLLKIEPGTVFYKKRERLNLPDEDETAELYLFMSGYLTGHGYRHYEISNFCKENRMGRHNLRYWQCKEYLGIGPGAHGYLNGIRFCQPPDLSAFLSGAPCEITDTGGDAEETFLLVLRTDAGVNMETFKQHFDVTFSPRFEKKTAAYKKQGLLTCNNGTMTLTPEGMLVSNDLIASLLAEMKE